MGIKKIDLPPFFPLYSSSTLILPPDYDRVISHHIQQQEYKRALTLLAHHSEQALSISDKVSQLVH